MIGSISHGIKGLVTSLEGGLYLVSSGLKKNDLSRMEEGCKAANETAGRIHKMVLNILYYAKKRELNRLAVEATEFATQVAGTLSSRFDENNIRLDCRFDENAGSMTVDGDYLHAALVNILENASDACLKDREKSTHQVTFSMAGRKKDVVFTIADDGIGMDHGTREQVFSLFFSTKGRNGTGLGLFITNRIVKQHSGTISVTSTPGKGTEFVIRIPRTPPVD